MIHLEMRMRHADGKFDLAVRSELDGVGDKIGQNLPQTRTVALDEFGNSPLNRTNQFEVPRGGFLRVEFENIFQRPAQRHRMNIEFEPARFDLREIENIVDESQQGFAAIAHRFQMVALGRVQGRIEQQTGEAEQAVHRGANLVAHDGEKFALGLVSRFRGDLGLIEFLLNLLAPGDVHAGADHAQSPPLDVAFHHATACADPEPFARFRPAAIFDVEEFRLALHVGIQALAHPADVLGSNRLFPKLDPRHHVVRTIAHQPRPFLAEVNRSGRYDPVPEILARRLEGEFEPLLVEGDGFLRAAPFAHVAQHRHESLLAVDLHGRKRHFGREILAVATAAEPLEPVITAIVHEAAHLHEFEFGGNAVGLEFGREIAEFLSRHLQFFRAMENGQRRLVAIRDAVLVEEQQSVDRILEQRTEFLLRQNALGDVVLDAHEMGDPSGLVAQRLDIERNPVFPSHLTVIGQLDPETRSKLDRFVHPRTHLRTGLATLKKLSRLLSHHLVQFVSRQPGKSAIDPLNIAALVGHDHSVVGLRRHARQGRLSTQFAFEFLEFVDLVRHRRLIRAHLHRFELSLEFALKLIELVLHLAQLTPFPDDQTNRQRQGHQPRGNPRRTHRQINNPDP